MDGMNEFSTDEWIQRYPNTPMAPSGGEPYENATSSTPVYRDSSRGTTGQDGPKPIHRRSRASRRTPVTVLNASTTDFRALVQRFTGCDSKENVSLVNLPKGPVNIDFARNDATESSSRQAYFDNQVVQPVGGWNHLQTGYGLDENASVVYESIDESSLMAAQRDGRSHGYNI
ncbi:VQ motif-containing protein 22-like [Bidens hawaiensis]|uniref:VQ motif-containing protein 22-like n=1 Tax=Bidens hawaiensis TaxID=980011 RepID=UPI00404A6265